MNHITIFLYHFTIHFLSCLSVHAIEINSNITPINWTSISNASKLYVLQATTLPSNQLQLGFFVKNDDLEQYNLNHVFPLHRAEIIIPKSQRDSIVDATFWLDIKNKQLDVWRKIFTESINETIRAMGSVNDQAGLREIISDQKPERIYFLPTHYIADNCISVSKFTLRKVENSDRISFDALTMSFVYVKNRVYILNVSTSDNIEMSRRVSKEWVELALKKW